MLHGRIGHERLFGRRLTRVTWAAVSLGTADLVFPWPLFVTAPGAVLLTLYVAGIGRPED